MENIIAIGLIIGLAWLLIRMLLPTSQPPQIIYIQATEPPRQESNAGCLPLLILGIVLFILAVANAGG